MYTIKNVPLHIDAFELLHQIPDDVIDLIFCDPPYNIGIFIKMSDDEYLDWCEQWIAESSRVLKDNGAFWICHKHPDILVELSKMIAEYGRGRINWITWDKYNDADSLQGFMDGYTVINGLRSFQVMAEYLVYHADEGQWTRQCDKERGFIFEPLRAYLADEKNRAGKTDKEMRKHLGVSLKGGGLLSHYWGHAQWALPTQEHYESLRELFNRNNGNEYLRKEYEDLRKEYEYLRKEYEYLRKEYEDLRYTFNSPGKVSSVWQIPPASKNGHPTPKPELLLERIIETTTNPGDLILDFFAGSFTTAVMAEYLDRQWICGDDNIDWVELGQQRLVSEGFAEYVYD